MAALKNVKCMKCKRAIKSKDDLFVILVWFYVRPICQQCYVNNLRGLNPDGPIINGKLSSLFAVVALIVGSISLVVAIFTLSDASMFWSLFIFCWLVAGVRLFSVPCGDGRNPSPSGEEKFVIIWSRAKVSPGSAHEARSEGSLDLDPQVP